MKIRPLLIILFVAFAFSATNNLAQNSQQNEALKNAERLIETIRLGDAEAATFYNAACFYALAGKPDEAFMYLDQAVARGYANVSHIKTDTDLTSLRDDARWQKTIEKAIVKEKEQQTAFWNKKEFWNNAALNTAYQENISENEKIAGLSKFWSEIKYNFANFDLVPGVNWDALYLKYIPKARNTKSTLEYYRVLQEMCAKLKDGHTNVNMPKELLNKTVARPLVRTGLIEDKVLITGILSDRLKQTRNATAFPMARISSAKAFSRINSSRRPSPIFAPGATRFWRRHSEN